MPNIQRVGDKNDAGAAILSTGQDSVFLDSVLVAVDGSPVENHGRGEHGHPKTIATTANVFINGIKIVVDGDKDTCGHTRVNGSSSTSLS